MPITDRTWPHCARPEPRAHPALPMRLEKRGQQGPLPCEDPDLLTAAYNCTPDQVASYCRLYEVLAVS